MNKNLIRYLLIVSLFISLLIIVPGNVSAAPTILPTSSSLVAVNGAVDYIQFAPGPTQTIGTTIILIGPTGDNITFVKTGIGGVNTLEKWTLNGVQVTGSPTNGWTNFNTGDLSGLPADGTWQIQIKPSGTYGSFDGGVTSTSPGPTLKIDTKAIHWGVISTFPPTFNQYWNWRSTAVSTTWNEPSTVPTCVDAGCFSDTLTEAADEDPNNAIFFQDTPSEYTAYTLHYGATPSNCTTTATDTINGAWIGASGTTFSEFIYRDGNFLAENTVSGDLRSVAGFSLTGEENEGSTGSGTDTKTINYNNIAGTSYQFKVRTATQGETLGVIQWIPSGLCSFGNPTIAIAEVHNEDEFDLTVSQAQCNNDKVSFSIDLELGSALITVTDLDVYILDATTATTVLIRDDAQMNAVGSRVFYFDEVIDTGAYTAIAKVDLAGLGSVDLFDSAAFNVPVGTCINEPTDLTGVFLAIQNVQNDVDFINGTTQFINNTTADGFANLTEFFEHINQHLHFINSTTLATEDNLTIFHINETILLTHLNEHLHFINNTTIETHDLLILHDANQTAFIVNTTEWFEHLNTHLHNLDIDIGNISTVLNSTYNNTVIINNTANHIHADVHNLTNLTEFINDTIVSNHLNETAFLNHLNNHLHDIDFNLTDYYNSLVDILQDLEDQATAHHMNMTEYFDHVNLHLHNINATFVNATINVNNTEILEAIDDLASFSIEQFPLLLIAIAFFVIMADTRNNFFYWFIAFILSIYLLIIRPVDSSIPIPVFVAWLFILIYNMFSFIANAKAQNLDGTPQ